MSAPLKVFLVENHADTRLLMRYLIEDAGHEVQEADSVADAVRAIPASGCDVLISDIGLPDGSGWDLLARLGANRPRFTIAMSGFGMSDDVEKSHAAGYRHHLVKPVEPDAIERLLREASVELEA